MARTEPQATLPVDHRDDARLDELNNLKLALATFALQLDAFEMRTHGGSNWAGVTHAITAPARNMGHWPAKGQDDWSIRSHGSRLAG